VLHYSKLGRLARDNHSSLLGQLTSYEENEMGPISYSFTFIQAGKAWQGQKLELGATQKLLRK
jgi:hypothetical protein